MPAGLKLLCGLTSNLVQLVDTLKYVFIIFTLTSSRQAVPKVGVRQFTFSYWKDNFSAGKTWCENYLLISLDLKQKIQMSCPPL